MFGTMLTRWSMGLLWVNMFSNVEWSKSQLLEALFEAGTRNKLLLTMYEGIDFKLKVSSTFHSSHVFSFETSNFCTPPLAIWHTRSPCCSWAMILYNDAGVWLVPEPFVYFSQGPISFESEGFLSQRGSFLFSPGVKTVWRDFGVWLAKTRTTLKSP